MLLSDVVYKRALIEPISKREEEARCLLAEAEKLEDQSNSEEAAKCYRKAFKMWPELEKDYNK